MNIKKLTVLFIGLVIVVAILYDVYAIYVGGTEASISSAIIVWSYNMPLIPFLAGVLCGHLFWRMRENKDTTVVIDKVDKDGNIS